MKKITKVDPIWQQEEGKIKKIHNMHQSKGTEEQIGNEVFDVKQLGKIYKVICEALQF